MQESNEIKFNIQMKGVKDIQNTDLNLVAMATFLALCLQKAIHTNGCN